MAQWILIPRLPKIDYVIWAYAQISVATFQHVEKDVALECRPVLLGFEAQDMVGRRICGGEYSHGNHGIGQLLWFEIPIVHAFLLGHSFVVCWRMSVSHDFSRVSIFVFSCFFMFFLYTRKRVKR